MENIQLQKSAEQHKNDPTPKEVLNPQQTSKLYSFRTYQPDSNLMPFVDYYWVMRWDLKNSSPFVAEIIPSPYTNLTFMPQGAIITGITTGKYTYELKDKGMIIGVKFKPGGLYAFWKKDMHELTNTTVSANHLFKEIDPLYNRAILNLDDQTAILRLNKLLQSKKPKANKNFDLITGVLDFLDTSDQPLLSSVVDYSKLSERRLQEIFREYVGVGIKWIILRTRLIKAAELASIIENPNWTTIAHDLGYTDQSHLINDFKRIIGKTPAQYAAEINLSRNKN